MIPESNCQFSKNWQLHFYTEKVFRDHTFYNENLNIAPFRRHMRDWCIFFAPIKSRTRWRGCDSWSIVDLYLRYYNKYQLAYDRLVQERISPMANGKLTITIVGEDVDTIERILIDTKLLLEQRCEVESVEIESVEIDAQVDSVWGGLLYFLYALQEINRGLSSCLATSVAADVVFYFPDEK